MITEKKITGKMITAKRFSCKFFLLVAAVAIITVFPQIVMVLPEMAFGK